MKKIIIIILAVVTLTSCKRGCQNINRSFQASDRDYHIEMYSGGKVVFEDNFTGILNNSENSDGVYYYKNGSLIEVSGDYIATSK